MLKAAFNISCLAVTVRQETAQERKLRVAMKQEADMQHECLQNDKRCRMVCAVAKTLRISS